jgi:hypothetical protein
LIAHQTEIEQLGRAAAAFCSTEVGGNDMIMPLYRCTVVTGKEAEFRELAFANGHAWLRGIADEFRSEV